MRLPLLLSSLAHGLALLLLVSGPLLWPGSRAATPPMLAEVELIEQKTPAVGPANAVSSASSAGTPKAAPAATDVRKAVTAELPLPPPPAPSPARPSPSAAPTLPAAALQAAARSAEPQAQGTGLVSGPQIVPAALDKTADNIPPSYPRQAVRRGEQGSVLLEVAVATDGTAAAVTVAASSGYPILDRTARKAVSAWHFIAARRAGHAVFSTMRLRIRFELKESAAGIR